VRKLLRKFITPPPGSPIHSDLQIEIKQIKDILRHEHAFVAAPPKKLQMRVIGLYSPHFIESGYRTFGIFEQMLASAGLRIQSCHTVLDFGCGCGRLIRAFHTSMPEAELFGTEIDAEAVQWLNENYQRFGMFSVNGHLPPLHHESERFDLIYGVSVFTHLPETMQLAWLAELHRVAKRGCLLLLTVYNEEQHRVLNASNRAKLATSGFCYIEESVSTTEGLPVFYQTAFHSHEYIRRVWGAYFEVLQIEPQALESHSDLVLLRKTVNS
jgi:cyclopropane fatty-acyl-phospholipid synthase-like methyltransferase